MADTTATRKTDWKRAIVRFCLSLAKVMTARSSADRRLAIGGGQRLAGCRLWARLRLWLLTLGPWSLAANRLDSIGPDMTQRF